MQATQLERKMGCSYALRVQVVVGSGGEELLSRQSKSQMHLGRDAIMYENIGRQLRKLTSKRLMKNC